MGKHICSRECGHIDNEPNTSSSLGANDSYLLSASDLPKEDFTADHFSVKHNLFEVPFRLADHEMHLLYWH